MFSSSYASSIPKMDVERSKLLVPIFHDTDIANSNFESRYKPLPKKDMGFGNYRPLT